MRLFLVLRIAGIILIGTIASFAQGPGGERFALPWPFGDHYRTTYRDYVRTHDQATVQDPDPVSYYATVLRELEGRRAALESATDTVTADAALQRLLALKDETYPTGPWRMYYPPISYPFVEDFFKDNQPLLDALTTSADGRRKAREVAAADEARKRAEDVRLAKLEADRLAAIEAARATKAKVDADLARAKRAKTSNERAAIYLGVLETLPDEPRALQGLRGVIDGAKDNRTFFRYVREFGDKVLTDSERTKRSAARLPSLRADYIRAGQHALQCMRTKAKMEAALRHTPSSQVRAAADRAVRYIQNVAVPAMQRFAESIQDITYAANCANKNGGILIRDWGIQGGFYPSMILR